MATTVKDMFVTFTKIGTPNVPVTVNLHNVLYSSGVEGNVTLTLVDGSTLNVIESIQEVGGV